MKYCIEWTRPVTFISTVEADTEDEAIEMISNNDSTVNTTWIADDDYDLEVIRVSKCAHKKIKTPVYK